MGARAHHKRVTAFLETFSASEAAKASGLIGRFGAVNVGQDCSWWDYGQIKLYSQNGLLLTKDTPDARLARLFFGIPEDGRAVASSLGSCELDASSVVSGAK